MNSSNPGPHRGKRGKYEFNACRIPWRIAVDYLLDSIANSRNFCDKMNNWLISNSNKPLYDINYGYKLDDIPQSTQDELEKFEAMKILCPFAISVMLSKNQLFLNELWSMIIHFNLEMYKNLDYYGNTIKMICLIILSNNYWIPYR